jgi:hypothetical protein
MTSIARGNAFAEGDEGWMKPKLQNGRDATARFVLQLLERIQIPGIDDHRLFADGVCPDAQCHADMCIVQIVRRADTQIVNTLLLGASAQLLKMAVESLDFCEKPDIKRISIQDTHRVMRIGRGNQPIPCGADRLEVSRRHEARDARDGKILQSFDPLYRIVSSKPKRDAVAMIAKS